MATRNRRRPILERALALLALSLTPMAKAKKPITRKLLLFKKTRRFKLLRHYNYAYIGAYEFSPSSTPLFHHYHRDSSILVKKKKRRHTHILSLLCGGGGNGSGGNMAASAEAEVLYDEVLSEWGEEEDFSVDGRAERFIEKFYEEQRIERQESLLQCKEMLQKIC